MTIRIVAVPMAIAMVMSGMVVSVMVAASMLRGDKAARETEGDRCQKGQHGASEKHSVCFGFHNGAAKT